MSSSFSIYPRQSIPYSAQDIVTVADITLAAAGSTLITSMTNNVKWIYLKSIAANTAVIRVSDGSVSATRGLELSPGESVKIFQNNLITHAFTTPAGQILNGLGFR